MAVRLPCLGTAGTGLSCRLPLSSRGAEALATALLTDDGALRRERLGALLRGEPALLLWCVCQSGRWPSRPPAAVSEVAQWLADNGLAALHWSEAEMASVAHSSSEQQNSWARLHAASRAADETLVLGLLTNAPQWLASSCDPSPSGSEEVCSLSPAWLISQTVFPEEGACEGKTNRAHEAIFAATSPAAESLPHLIHKLARLADLEAQFASELEREKLAALKELAYGASHEINNPLANISTRAQALLRDETDPERRRKLATINSQAFRAHEMISDMMLFAKPPRLVREPIDVVKLVDQVIGETLPDAREQGTLVTRSSGPQSLVLSIDGGQMAVALKALLSNSLEALGCGGRIEIIVNSHGAADHEPSTAAEIVVSDTGPGISPEVRRHLFDPFYSGREAGRGLGFGLSKCWRIVTDHGGRIEVESELGKGAKFTIFLPADRL